MIKSNLYLSTSSNSISKSTSEISALSNSSPQNLSDATSSNTCDSSGDVGANVSKSFSLKDLKGRFDEVSIDSAIFCTGFRSYPMTKASDGAVGGMLGNAKWTGVRLRDVLIEAGLAESKIFESGNSNKFHVHLTGLDGYAMSIPLEVAISYERDVLLCYAMNGEPLSRDHGFPLRVLVPSYVGARSVKWIESIEIKPYPSDSPWYKNIYRIWPKHIDHHEKVPLHCPEADKTCPPVECGPINSLVLLPEDGSRCNISTSGSLEIKGVAIPGNGTRIVRVEVEVGGVWREAKLTMQHEGGSTSAVKNSRNWAWQPFTLAIPKDELKADADGEVTIRC